MLQFEHNGVMRDYELSIPEGYDGQTKAPVIVSLHGFTSNIAQEDAATRFPTEGGKRGYVVVTPLALNSTVQLPMGNVTGPLWNTSAFVPPVDGGPTGMNMLSADPAKDDVGFIFSLLDSLATSLCIDTGRVYASGVSNGAGMSVALMCSDDQRFAAVAPVAGVNMTPLCPVLHGTPIIAFHGTADMADPYTGQSVLGLQLNLPSVEDQMAHLAGLGECSATPTKTMPFSDIEHRVWDCPAPMGAELYTVIGGGHTWFGATSHGGTAFLGTDTKSIDATTLILDFFDMHKRSK
jgi:polyhydroxybutyrate depolymerase